MPNYNPNKDRYMKGVEYLLIILGLGIIAMTTINVSAFLIFPTAPAVFGNVLPDEWYMFPVHYIFPLYIIPYCYANVAAVTGIAVILGTVYIPFIVKELRVGRSKYKTVDELRYSENLKVVYRMAQLNQIRINGLAGKLLIPAQAMVTLVFVFGGYVVIRHRSQMSTVPFLMVTSWTFAAAFGWGLVLTMGGYLQSHGVKILKSWKQHPWRSKNEKKEMNKFAKSCRPIMMCYGKMFAIRRVSLMSFVRGMTRGLMRAILTLER